MHNIQGKTNPTLLLSVCIPTYNRSAYLDQCLAVLVPQAKAVGINIFLSDNASTDDTPKIIAKYQTHYAQIFHVTQNANLGFDKNHKAVIGMAATEFAWLLGDDDVITDGALEKVISALRNYSACELVLLNAFLTDNNLQPRGKQFEIECNEILKDCNDLLRLHSDKLTFGMMVINTRMFNAIDADRFIGTAHFYAGGVYEYLAHSYTRAKQNHILLLNEPLVFLRQGERSWSHAVGDISVRQIPEFYLRMHACYSVNARIGMKRAVGSYRTLLPLARLRAEGWLDREKAKELRKYYVDEHKYRLFIFSTMPIFIAAGISKFGIFFARLLKTIKRRSYEIKNKSTKMK